MNKKLYYFFISLSSLVLFISCTKDNTEKEDKEWRDYQQRKYNEITSSPDYQKMISRTGNGNLYWKKSSVITDAMKEEVTKTLKITPEGTPYVTDSVVTRYSGWFYDKNGTKYTFDSTEGSANGQAGRGFRLNQVVPGWADMLMYMTTGEEVEMCIPYQLGYGVYGKKDANGNVVIPIYTTLFFNIKLLKIVPDNPGEF